MYYSFKPEPQFAGDPFLPGWLQWFGDTFPDFRTFVPYFCFAGLSPFLVSGKSRVGPGRVTLWVSIGLWIFLVISEWIQVYLPQRSATWMDVFWGTAGVVTGAIVGRVVWKMWNTIRHPDASATQQSKP
ncbi:MAG: VanZ family protein [Puniceicoccales bacterium]